MNVLAEDMKPGHTWQGVLVYERFTISHTTYILWADGSWGGYKDYTVFYDVT